MQVRDTAERTFVDLRLPISTSTGEIRSAVRELPSLVDREAGGSSVLISRRGRPLTALSSAAEYERLQEFEHRNDGLRAILGGRGIRLTPWRTAEIVEGLTGLGAG